jgi:hypothetical protein
VAPGPLVPIRTHSTMVTSAVAGAMVGLVGFAAGIGVGRVSLPVDPDLFARTVMTTLDDPRG